MYLSLLQIKNFRCFDGNTHKFMFNKKPEDVFVIRTSTVNEELYVNRDDLEKELKRLVKTAPNIIIKGESGCGKTWLYKNVFDKENINYEIIDLSKAIKVSVDFFQVVHCFWG